MILEKPQKPATGGSSPTQENCAPMQHRPLMLQRVRLDSATTVSMARRGVLSTVGVVVQGVTRFITNVLIGRIGGPTVLGSVASAISTAQLFALLWPTTTGSAASKFIAQARGKGAPAEAAAVAAHLAKRTIQSGLALSILSVPVWTLIDHGGLAGAGTVAALIIGYSGYSFTRGLQFGAGQVPRATAWDLATSALGMMGVLALLIVGVRGIMVVLPLAAAYVLFALAGWPWGVHGRPAPALRREIDGFVALGVVGTVASAGFLQLSMIVARLSDGAASAGQYAAALTLATPASLFAMSFSLVLFPSMAEAWGRGDVEGFNRQTDRATRALVMTMTAVFGSMALCSPLIVSVVWGQRYSHAATLLPILLLAVLANTIGVACTNALTSRSHRGMVTSTVASLIGMAVGALSWAVLAPEWGTLGVAIGYLCGTMVIAAIPIVIVWRRDGHRWAGLALRLAAGLTLIVALLIAERTFSTSLWLEPVIALAFVGGWLVLMGEDAKAILALARRHRV